MVKLSAILTLFPGQAWLSQNVFFFITWMMLPAVLYINRQFQTQPFPTNYTVMEQTPNFSSWGSPSGILQEGVHSCLTLPSNGDFPTGHERTPKWGVWSCAVGPGAQVPQAHGRRIGLTLTGEKWPGLAFLVTFLLSFSWILIFYQVWSIPSIFCIFLF